MATKRHSTDMVRESQAAKRQLQFSSDGAVEAVGPAISQSPTNNPNDDDDDGGVLEGEGVSLGMGTFEEMTALAGALEANSRSHQHESMIREQDRFLPIANVSRIMKRVLPDSGKVAKEAKECVQECVSEFISFITSEASERCMHEKRKTINGEDILWAMQTLGFDQHVEPLKIYLSKYRLASKGEKHHGGGAGAGVSGNDYSNRANLIVVEEGVAASGPSNSDAQSSTSRPLFLNQSGELVLGSNDQTQVHHLSGNVIVVRDESGPSNSDGGGQSSTSRPLILSQNGQDFVLGSGDQQTQVRLATNADGQLTLIEMRGENGNAEGGDGAGGTQISSLPQFHIINFQI